MIKNKEDGVYETFLVQKAKFTEKKQDKIRINRNKNKDFASHAYIPN